MSTPIPFDPDFDQKTSPVSVPLVSPAVQPPVLWSQNIPPRVAFMMGVLIAVGAITMIGNFILLSLLIK